MADLPKSTQILVIGGGPAGSTAATLLAREGFQVTLAERERFPRYHIGESLLPSLLDFLDLLGAREKVEQLGFQYKPGAHIEWGSQEWELVFGELSGKNSYSFQVIRSEFDQCLLDHSGSQGVQVFQGVEVSEILFDQADPERPYAAILSSVDNPDERQELSFDFLIDASGRAGVMSSRYLRNRYYHEVFKNVAIWGYWRNTKRFPGEREGAIAVVAIPEGWIWGIPLHDGTMSVGIVIHKNSFKAKKSKQTRQEIYHECLAQAPTIMDMLAPGHLASEIYLETDYSYAAESFSGPGYFLAGDAACFLDPLLSTGVHLAMLSGLLSAASITSIIRGEIGQDEALEYYDKSYRYAYLRFLTFLLAFYKQYRGKESVFWMARELSNHDAPDLDIKKAFTSLVAGVEDLKDVREVVSDTREYVLEQMAERVKENLEFRRDKATMAAALENNPTQPSENHQFFSRVEGIGVLSPEDAVHGLYVTAKPRLGLVRTNGANIGLENRTEAIPGD